MNRFSVVVALVLAVSVVGAGVYVTTGVQTPANNTTATPTSSGSTPTTTATLTPTPTPVENESETPESPSNDTSSSANESKYVAMMRRILRSDDINMTSLDTPLPENNTLHSGMVEIKLIETEEYASGTENDTRLRIEYYNTNHEGDGINEVRVISLAYSHIINKSIEDNDVISFDEIDIISYQNRSSMDPAGRLKIDESWAAYYATGTWSGYSYVKTFTGTTEMYLDGNFG